MAAAAPLSRRLLPRLKLHRSLCQFIQKVDSCGPFPLPVQDDINKGAPISENFDLRPRPLWSPPYLYFVKRSDATDNAMFLRLVVDPDTPYPWGYDICLYQVCLRPPFSQPSAARQCLGQMLLRGSLPGSFTFSLILQAYCKDLQLSHLHVLDLFKGMKSLRVEPVDSFYKDVMDPVFARFGYRFGYQLLKKLTKSFRMKMPLWFYEVLVGRFCRKKMVEDAEIVSVLIDVLIDMKKQRVSPDEKIYKHLYKGRDHGGDDFLKAGSIGRQIFARGMKIGAISPVKRFVGEPARNSFGKVVVEDLINRSNR